MLGLYSYSILKKLPVNAPYSIPFVLSIVGYFLVNIRLLTGIEIDFAFTLSLILFVAEILIFVLFLGRVYINEESEKIIVERNLDFNIEQNNRLKELDNLKNNFFTNISHEFRTPLTIIASPIQELMAKYPADSLLPIMNRNAQRLLALINQLLDISKLEAKQMKVEISEDNLALYLRTLINSFSSWAESQKISFEFTQDQLDVVAYFDKDKLEKIITNLLSNAFKFTPEGGKITVNARFSEDAKTLKLDVSDTGLGIEAIHLTRIFDRYYQVDSAKNQNYESTGIGLALVKELIGVLKGTIQVSSQKNIGTTFSIEIPVVSCRGS